MRNLAKFRKHLLALFPQNSQRDFLREPWIADAIFAGALSRGIELNNPPASLRSAPSLTQGGLK